VPALPTPYALLLALLAGGCRAGDGAGVIDFWAMGAEGAAVERMVPEFERQHPGRRVRVQQVPWSAAHEKLLTAYVGDVTPCVFQLGNTWIPEFVALGAIEPLDDRVAASPVVKTADYFPGILDTNIVGGRLYAVPWYVDTRLLFYRRDLLAAAGVTEPPESWGEWLAAMENVRRATGTSHAILLPLTEWPTPVILAMQLGAGLLRDDDRFGDFQSAAFRRAFAFYLDLFARDLAPRGGDADVGNLYQDFAAGRFAFLVTGPWNLVEFDRRLPRGFGPKWATAPMPAPEPPGPGVSLAGGSSLAIFRACADKDAAFELIESLSSPERQLEFYRLSGDLPPRRSAWARGGLADDPRTGAFARQLEHVRSTPKIPEWERIAARIAQVAEAAIRGNLSADEALATLDRETDAILEKRRWMLERTQDRP
jgi:multiple sugar transport system substrate-binding protein